MAQTRRPSQPRKSSRWRRALALVALCYGLLVAFFIVAALRYGSIQTLDAVGHAVTLARPYLHAMQIATLIMLWWRWTPFVEWLARRQWVNARMKPQVIAARNRILLMLCVIQVVLVMGWPLGSF